MPKQYFNDLARQQINANISKKTEKNMVVPQGNSLVACEQALWGFFPQKNAKRACSQANSLAKYLLVTLQEGSLLKTFCKLS